MLVISTLIAYKTRVAALKLKLSRAERVKARRAVWAANGQCLQCGGDRPCKKCGHKTVLWRRKQSAQWREQERKRKRW